MTHITRPLLGALLVLFLLGLPLGCSRYQITLNETTLYTPPPLFLNFPMADQALYQCIAAHIQEGEIIRAAQLTQLNCSHNTIQSLAGLDIFSNLSELNLSNNALSSVVELQQLHKLKHLNLSSNAIEDLAPLLFLPSLESLQLAESPKVKCATFWRLQPFIRQKPQAPEHCRIKQQTRDALNKH